jgi:hypothetical protein
MHLELARLPPDRLPSRALPGPCDSSLRSE